MKINKIIFGLKIALRFKKKKINTAERWHRRIFKIYINNKI